MLVYLTYLIVFLLPLYLIRLKFFWVPTTVLELMIYALSIVWLVSLLRFNLYRRVEVKPQQMWFFIPIALLLIGCVISTIVSCYKLTSLGILKGWFVGPLLFFIVLVSIIKTKKQVRDILTCFSLSGAIVGIIGLFYLFAGNLTFDGRLRAIFSSPNHLAMYLAPALLISFWLFLTSSAKIKYFFWFPIFTLTVIPLYFTLSYGAWLGVIAGGLFLFRFFVKGFESSQKRKTILLYCCIAVLLIIVIGTLQLRTEKFQSFLYSTRSSFQSRLMIWRAGISILKDQPIWGTGLGTFQEYYLDYRSYFKEPYLEWAVPQPHNLFLAFWLQTGILGLIGFVWIVVWFFRKGLAQINIVRALHVTPLLAVMIYILVHGLVDSTYWKNDLAMIFWMIVGLMLILSRLEENL